MVTKKQFTFISLSAGSFGGVLGLKTLGGTPKFICEPRDLDYKNIEINFSQIPSQKVDARWFYNRKEKGTSDLLSKANISVGELDVLEASVLHSVRDTSSKSLPNFYDIFSLAKRIQPKLLIAIGPSELSADKNLPFLENQLEHLRYVKPKDTILERAYYVGHRVLNSADFGSSISKSYTVIIGLREDVAHKLSLAADLAILNLFPSPANFKTKSFGDIAKDIQNKNGEEAFWDKEILSNTPLLKAARFLKKEPSKNTFLTSQGEHQLKKIGYKKTGAKFVTRCSFEKPLPDISEYDPLNKDDWGLLHPLKNRSLTATEIAAAIGLPVDFKLTGNEYQKTIIASQSIPPSLIMAIAQHSLAIINGPIKKQGRGEKVISDYAHKVQLAERLRANDELIRTYHCDIDLGDSYARELQGITPTDQHYDYVFDANEIGQDFVVSGPVDPSTGFRAVIGGIKCSVYSNDDRKRLVDAINTIKGVSEYRGNCSPEPIRQEIIEDLKIKKRKYELSSDKRSYRVWIELKKGEKEGHWDRWRTNPIPSATEGWSLDKNTRKPQLSKTLTNNPRLKIDFDYLNEKANYSYLKIAPSEYKKQSKFIKSRMNPKYCLGKTVFTSLAINKYGDEMPAMNFHIDSGDNNSGLTSITVFNKGAYQGGYFVLPQYKIAFRVGDSDVFVGNSRKVHGVTKIEGTGVL